MSNFAEVMSTNPPRLVVQFQRGRDGGEQFQWGVVGAIPILTLIGYIGRVQADLVVDAWIPECDTSPPSLVVAWDARDRTLSHYVHPDVPTDPLGGMLETIKQMLVDSRLAQFAAAQRTQILGPDGQPMRA